MNIIMSTVGPLKEQWALGSRPPKSSTAWVVQDAQYIAFTCANVPKSQVITKASNAKLCRFEWCNNDN